jgi:hypothetical protein
MTKKRPRFSVTVTFPQEQRSNVMAALSGVISERGGYFRADFYSRAAGLEAARRVERYMYNTETITKVFQNVEMKGRLRTVRIEA